MRDRYPAGSSVPADYLVPPELQPEFSELPGYSVDEIADVGREICAVGEGTDDAVIHAETGRSYTYAELDTLSTRFAVGLRELGVVLGDRVALRSANVPEIVIVALACWKAGAVVVPTPAMAREAELSFFLQDTGARLLLVSASSELLEAVPKAIEGSDVEWVIAFGDDAPIPGVRWWRELMPEDADATALPPVPSDSVAIIWHTGGTTGEPKAIYHTHRRLLLGSHALARATEVAPRQRWTAAAPVGHALGFASHTVWPLLHGATVVMVEAFPSPEALTRAISEYRIEGFAAITMTWARMLEVIEADPELDVSSLNRTYAMWQSAASSAVYDSWKARGAELLNNFGCTSFASWILAPNLSEPTPRASLGRAVPGYEVVALDLNAEGIEVAPAGAQGRLAARGVSGLTYWNRPALQERDVRDGWVLIDDVVSFDEDGNATYYGRTDYIISTAGHKVPPIEIEEVLATHPAVREVGVIGAPDPVRQETVMAFVVLEEEAADEANLKNEMQDFVKARIAPYKYPRRIEFIDQLPRDHVGKLQPQTLREWAAHGVETAT